MKVRTRSSIALPGLPQSTDAVRSMLTVRVFSPDGRSAIMNMWGLEPGIGCYNSRLLGLLGTSYYKCPLTSYQAQVIRAHSNT